MRLDIDWQDERAIRRLFSWITRCRLCPRWGSGVPIGYYQADQSQAIRGMEAALKAAGLPPESEVKMLGEFFVAQRAPRARWLPIGKRQHGKFVAMWPPTEKGTERC